MTREEILSAARQTVTEDRGYGEAEEFTREEILDKLAAMARKYQYHAQHPGPGATAQEKRNLRLKAAALGAAADAVRLSE